MEDKYIKIMKDVAKWKEAFYEDIKENYIAKLSKEEKLKLAKDPDTSIFFLAVLGEDPDAGIRMEVAKHPLMPYVEDRELEEKLAKDPNAEIRKEVAKRSDILPTTVDQLANDPDPGVRKEIAKRSDLFPSTEDQLTNDQDREVRMEIAKNPAASTSNIKQLANDPDPEVRAAARKKLNEILRH